MPKTAASDWTQTETDTLLDLIRAHGAQAFYRHASAAGRSPDACRMHIQRQHREAWMDAMAAWRTMKLSQPPVMRAPQVSPQQMSQIDAWWDRFAPVHLDPPPTPKAKVTANTGVTIVASDFHFPLQDDAAVSVFLQTVKAMRPQRVVLNGDLPDLLAISRYPKDVRQTWSLQEEAVAYLGFLRALEEVLPDKAQLIELDANHSGNGTESRWWRYLSDRIPELLTTARARTLMSYQAWWHPEWSRIEMEPELVIGPDLLITHGTIVRRGGGMSAKAHSESYLNSVMHGHTHRQGSHMRRVPAVGGRGEQVIKAYETGCMCRLDPGYVKVPDWTQGFAIIVEGAASYGVELVTIENGVATVAALGQTITA
jgi:hypothetical protein